MGFFADVIMGPLTKSITYTNCVVKADATINKQTGIHIGSLNKNIYNELKEKCEEFYYDKNPGIDKIIYEDMLIIRLIFLLDNNEIKNNAKLSATLNEAFKYFFKDTQNKLSSAVYVLAFNKGASF